MDLGLGSGAELISPVPWKAQGLAVLQLADEVKGRGVSEGLQVRCLLVVGCSWHASES